MQQRVLPPASEQDDRAWLNRRCKSTVSKSAGKMISSNSQLSRRDIDVADGTRASVDEACFAQVARNDLHERGRSAAFRHQGLDLCLAAYGGDNFGARAMAAVRPSPGFAPLTSADSPNNGVVTPSPSEIFCEIIFLKLYTPKEK